jgi:hypothetical protein
MTIQFSLQAEHFSEILNKGYSLDLMFLLRMVKDGNSVEFDGVKVKALQQTLLRKGLVTDKQTVTPEGEALLEFLSSPVKTKFVKPKPVIDDFDEWWKTYPGTDNFTHKGKTFDGSRTLRVKKDDCKAKIKNIISEGEYTMKDMIDALKLEVLQKKESSVKTGTNKLSYMQNSLTYLNQRTFEPFIELVKEGKKIEESPEPIKGFDI